MMEEVAELRRTVEELLRGLESHAAQTEAMARQKQQPADGTLAQGKAQGLRLARKHVIQALSPLLPGLG